MSLAVNVGRRLGAFALDARFETGPGVTALFGHSGAGKSTIVAMVAGLARPDRGRIALNGRTLFDAAVGADVPARRRNVGVVFQEPRLFPHLSVRRNLLYGRWAGRRTGATSFDVVVALLGLETLLHRSPTALSGGEAQRVAIGRALLADPAVLLMDEPLSQLDGARRAEILPFLERLAHEGGVPILYVSHAVEEVARLADDIVVLSEGKVAAVGRVGDVFGRIDLGPVTGRYQAGSVLTAVIAAQDHSFALTRLKLGEAEISVPAIVGEPGLDVRLRVRARDVALALAPVAGTSIRNVVPGVVTAVALELGAYAEVQVAVAGQSLRARLTRRSAVELGLKPGTPVFALIKTVAVEATGGSRT